MKPNDEQMKTNSIFQDMTYTKLKRSLTFHSTKFDLASLASLTSDITQAGTFYYNKFSQL
jgi:hypothetical protein